MTAAAEDPAAGPRLTAPELLVHLFLTARRQDPAESWERFRSVWQHVTGQLGLDRAIEPLGVPWLLPPAPPEGEAGTGPGAMILAAAERDTERIWQAAAWAQHDALCLTVMMAPARQRDCAAAWPELERAWAAARPAILPGALLGEARLFLALAGDGPDARPARPGGIAALVRAAAPPPSGDGWWQHWDPVPLGSAGDAHVWEAGPESHDARACRRFVVVAPIGAEQAADRLLWTSGDGQPAPLTQHLLQAARLRHQVRVFDGGRAAYRRKDELRLLARDQAAGPGGTSLPAGRLAYARDAALALAGILGEMRHAVTVLGGSLRVVLNLPDGSPATGPLSDDQDLARWFGQRIDDEITGLETAATAAAPLLAAPRARTRPGPHGAAAGGPRRPDARARR